MSEDQVDSSAFYDSYWAEDDEWNRVHPGNRHRARLIIRELWRISQEVGSNFETLLDVGCGNGQLLRRVGDRFPRLRLFGEDISPRAACLTADVAEETFVHDLERTPLEGHGDFDLAVMSEVLEHIAESVSFLRNLKPALKPNARLIITVPTGPMTAFDREIGHIRHFTLHELEARCREAGYETLCAYRWGFPFFDLFRAIAWLLGKRARSAKPTSHGALGHLVVFLLNASFYLCLRSRWIGRQVVSIVTPADTKEATADE